MKVNYTNKPDILVPVGDGSYLYHWDIQETVQSFLDDNICQITYDCEEVTVYPPITSNRITEAVISELWDNNYEQKLVNEYNAVQLGVYTETDAQDKVQAYMNFLSKRKSIKEQIDRDCIQLNIKD